MTDSPNPSSWQSVATSRGFVLPIIQALIIGSCFVAVLLFGYHAPHPRNAPVGVVATTPQTLRALQQIAVAAPGSIDLHRVATLEAGLRRLRANNTFAVLDLTTTAPTLHVVGANGPSVNAALTRLLNSADITAAGAVAVIDELPMGPDDSAGLPIFYLVFGVVLASYLFAIGSVNLGVGLNPAHHWASAAVLAVTLAAVATTLASAGTGTIATAQLSVFALLAAASFATSAASALCMRLSRAWGTVAATVVLITVGNASGGLLPAEFLPPWLAVFRPLLPMGIVLSGIRDAEYFGGHDTVVAVASLAAWAIVSIALMSLRAAPTRGSASHPTDQTQTAPPTPRSPS
jgi:hypothetical protein